ncbi:hypothetical protein COCON_G00082420 [Conger conger]|uniref:Uncharacterized protein n=1 Tax=Conger conger TaxID=82655 RepID=A0A9Q1DQ01_CONCO|nr:hypothetical protein COCON_G00082420 [Conger conger]
MALIILQVAQGQTQDGIKESAAKITGLQQGMAELSCKPSGDCGKGGHYWVSTTIDDFASASKVSISFG